MTWRAEPDLAASDPREAALRLLLRVEDGAYTSYLLASRTLDRFPPRDRSLIQELVLGVLRNRCALDFVIDRCLDHPRGLTDPRMRNLLRLGLYQLSYLDRIPDHAAVSETVGLAKLMLGVRGAGLINAVLRRASREELASGISEIPDLPTRLSAQYSHPEWLVRRWLCRFGPSRTEEILRADNLKPAVYFHIMSSPPESVIDELARSGAQIEPATPPAGCWRLEEGHSACFHRLRNEGRLLVVDRASQWVAQLLDIGPGMRALDLCAAPGGKCLIAARALRGQGMMVANDLHPSRMKHLSQTARRADLPWLLPVVWDAAGIPPLVGDLRFDRILLDAPCSGTGTLRRNPDLRWRLRPESLEPLRSLQQAMLGQAADRLQSSGRLVYSTCSLEPEENEEVIGQFLATHPDFDLEAPVSEGALVEDGYFKTHPLMEVMDGFFAAILIRRSKSSSTARRTLHGGRTSALERPPHP